MAYKVCPACAEEVQARAKKCKHCGENLSEVASRRSLGEVLGIGCAALFALSAFVTCFADPQPHRRAAPTSTSSSAPAEDLSRVREEAAERAAEAAAQRERDAAEARPKLKVLSYQWGREYGYITLEGEVKNLSDEPLDGLQAVASFYKGETFVTSDAGMVEYQPLLPRQTSPFKVMLTDNPAIDGATVEFKEIFGGTVRTEFAK